MATWLRRLAYFLRQRRREAELREELETHLAMRAEELERRGLSPQAAADASRRALGHALLAREDARDVWLGRYIADAWTDLWFTWRQFRRQPGHWGVIAVTLIVGIAAATNLFAVVDGVLLKPLPYPEPDRLVRLTTWNLRGEYVHLRERATTMDIAAYYPSPREVTVNLDGRPARLPAAGVTADLFQVLGVTPVLGRTFRPEEMRVGGPGITGGTFWRTYGVVMVSSAVWRDLFGGRPDVIGARLAVEGVPHTVVGVLPADFHFPARNLALWFPHNLDPAALWNGNVAMMIGRLEPGRTPGDARAEMRALMPGFATLIPWARYVRNYGTEGDAQPLQESIVGNARRVLLVVLGAIGVVVLILCVNVANLLLARGLARDKEMLTRAALGAGGGRIARQVVVENLSVALISGAGGLLVAYASLRLLVTLLPSDLPRLELVRLDLRVALFALGASVATGLAFGLLPVIRAARAGTRLVAATRGVVSEARERRLSGALAAVELAFAVVLTTAAVVLLQSLWNLMAIDPGFQVSRLVTARISPPGFEEVALSARVQTERQLLERLSQNPTVRSAALANALPFDAGLHGTVFNIDRRPPVDGRPAAAAATYLGVSDGYFGTMGIPLVAGRPFTSADDVDGPRVAIVSRRLARMQWGNESPLGARIRFADNRQFLVDAQGQEPAFTVVGVVGDVHFTTVTDEAPPMVYLPLDQFWDVQSLRVVIRTTERSPGVAGMLQELVSGIDPATAVSSVDTYESRLGETIARPRFVAYMLTGFALVALGLAAVGTYGVLIYSLNRRIPEIGVRLAFGASGREVFGLLFRQGLRLTAAGLAVGIPAALLSTRFLSALLFDVDPLDPAIHAVIATALFAVGAAVSYLPARRASHIDPIAALRQE